MPIDIFVIPWGRSFWISKVKIIHEKEGDGKWGKKKIDLLSEPRKIVMALKSGSTQTQLILRTRSLRLLPGLQTALPGVGRSLKRFFRVFWDRSLTNATNEDNLADEIHLSER